MKKGKPNLAVVFLLLICIVLLGVVVGLSYYIINGNADAGIIYTILMWIGVALMALVLFTLLSYVSVSRRPFKSKKKQDVEEDEEEEEERKPKAKKKKKPEPKPQPKPQPKKVEPKEERPKQAPQKQAEVMPDAEAKLDSSTTYNGSQVSYMPSKEAYAQAASAGRVQSVDEKFEQISKMGKAQFVVYMSKLFKLKGYQVELTPVANNHGIDMLVEKMGVKIAVGCALSNKVLGETDVRLVEQGKKYYGIDRAMVVTNQYFDRAAAAYGKAQSTSLVDRNVLAEDFMR